MSITTHKQSLQTLYNGLEKYNSKYIWSRTFSINPLTNINQILVLLSNDG